MTERAGARGATLGESLFLPLDRARAAFNRALLHGAPSLQRKDTRVTWRALVGIGVSLTLALCAPMLLFALAPIVLGVPHLAADVRYLVVRPRYPRLARTAMVVGCLPFVAVRIWPELALGGLDGGQLEMLCAAAALLVAASSAGLSARAFGRLALAIPGLIGLSYLAFEHANTARLVFAHAHNLVGVAVWLLVFRPRTGTRASYLLPLFAIALGLLAVFAYGALLPAAELDRPGPGGMTLSGTMAWMAPGLPVRLGAGVIVSYVFLQSVHYSVWLGLIPEDTVRGDAVRSFRMSWRALLRDFGGWGLGLVVALTLVVVALARRDVEEARNAYLSLSAFHGYLELVVLTVAACGRRALIADAG